MSTDVSGVSGSPLAAYRSRNWRCLLVSGSLSLARAPRAVSQLAVRALAGIRIRAAALGALAGALLAALPPLAVAVPWQSSFFLQIHRKAPNDVGVATYPFTGSRLEAGLDAHPRIMAMARFSWGRGSSMSIIETAPRATLDVYVIGKQWCGRPSSLTV